MLYHQGPESQCLLSLDDCPQAWRGQPVPLTHAGASQGVVRPLPCQHAKQGHKWAPWWMKYSIHTEFFLLTLGKSGCCPLLTFSSQQQISEKLKNIRLLCGSCGVVELAHWAKTLPATLTYPSFFEIVFCARSGIEGREVAGTGAGQEPVIREDHTL